MLVGPLRVHTATREEAAHLLTQQMKSGKPVSLAYANTNLINWSSRSPEVRRVLGDFTVFNDGIGMEIAGRLTNGKKRFKADLNGSDFTPYFLSQLPSDTRVFLLGGVKRSVAGAAKVIAETCDVKIVGAHDGYSFWDRQEDVIEEINAARPDVLLVALGNPKQELWIAKHRSRLPCKVCIGVGNLFNFLSGETPRAPLWMRRMRIEWLHRLMQEPFRLGKRYTIDIVEFFSTVILWAAARRTGWFTGLEPAGKSNEYLPVQQDKRA